MTIPSDDKDFAIVRASAKLYALDRYYAALMAPKSMRDDLIALAAFTGEIERIGREVSETPLAEIRLAWWRDALLARAQTGNPVLDAFAATVARRQLDLAPILTSLDAESQALYPHIRSDAGDETLSVATRGYYDTAFRILGGRPDAHSTAGIEAAGRASGHLRSARDLPYALRFGRAPMRPARSDGTIDWRQMIAGQAAQASQDLTSVRAQVTDEPRILTTALLPLALIEPHFRALQKPGHDPTRDISEIAPLTQLWRIAHAHWTGRL